MVGAGQRGDFTEQSFALNDRLTATVNVGTGNLELAATDVVLPAVGGSVPLGRVYNSLDVAVGASEWFSNSFGYDWRSNQAPDVHLVAQADQSVAYVTASGNVASFALSAGVFVTPPGLDATLPASQNGDASIHVDLPRLGGGATLRGRRRPGLRRRRATATR